MDDRFRPQLGLRLDGQPVEAWLRFACTLRASELTGARELPDRDLATLADRPKRERNS